MVIRILLAEEISVRSYTTSLLFLDLILPLLAQCMHFRGLCTIKLNAPLALSNVGRVFTMVSLLIIIYILVYLIEKSFISSKINSNRVPSQIVFFFHIRLPLL